MAMAAMGFPRMRFWLGAIIANLGGAVTGKPLIPRIGARIALALSFGYPCVWRYHGNNWRRASQGRE